MNLPLTSRRSQPPLARSVPLSRFTPRVGSGSAFFVDMATMKMPVLISLVICIVLECSGCASLNAPPPTYPVNSNSTLEMIADFKYWPEMSGYYLPVGIYKVEAEDARGVFLKLLRE